MSKTRVVHVEDRVADAVDIGRAVPDKRLKQSKWHNPYRIGVDGDRAAAIKKYRKRMRSWMTMSPASTTRDLRLLAGKPLACWCRRDGEERTEENACHGDVLVELIREIGLEDTT